MATQMYTRQICISHTKHLALQSGGPYGGLIAVHKSLLNDLFISVSNELPQNLRPNWKCPRRSSCLDDDDFCPGGGPEPRGSSVQLRCASAFSDRLSAQSIMDRIQIEKDDHAGGITIGKVFVSTSCNIIIIIMAIIFLLIGTVLSAVAYRPRDFGEEMTSFMERQNWSWESKIIGPSFLVIGLLMLVAGITLCVVGYKISKIEMTSIYRETLKEPTGYQITSSSNQCEVPLMPTISQAVPVGVMTVDQSLPLLLPMSVLSSFQAATTSSNPQQAAAAASNTLRPSLDSSMLLDLDLSSLRPRSSSLQMMPFTSNGINDKAQLDVGQIPMRPTSRTPLGQAKTTGSGRRQSLPSLHSQSELPSRNRTSNKKASEPGHIRPKLTVQIASQELKALHESLGFKAKLRPNPSKNINVTTINGHSPEKRPGNLYSVDKATSPGQWRPSDLDFHHYHQDFAIQHHNFASSPSSKRDIACFPTSLSDSQYQCTDSGCRNLIVMVEPCSTEQTAANVDCEASSQVSPKISTPSRTLSKIDVTSDPAFRPNHM